MNLKSTAVNDGGLEVELDGAGVAAGGLEGADNVHRVIALLDLAKDDVLAIEPWGLLGGDEELGAVAGERRKLVKMTAAL